MRSMSGRYRPKALYSCLKKNSKSSSTCALKSGGYGVSGTFMSEAMNSGIAPCKPSRWLFVQMSWCHERHFFASESGRSSITGASWTIKKSITSGLAATSSRHMMAHSLFLNTTALSAPIALMIQAALRACWGHCHISCSISRAAGVAAPVIGYDSEFVGEDLNDGGVKAIITHSASDYRQKVKTGVR